MEIFRNNYQDNSETMNTVNRKKSSPFINVIRQIRYGARFVPAYILISYFLLISLDLFSTYLASPDLTYEGNIFIRFFNMGWREILIVFPLHAITDIFISTCSIQCILF